MIKRRNSDNYLAGFVGVSQWWGQGLWVCLSGGVLAGKAQSFDLQHESGRGEGDYISFKLSLNPWF